MLYHLLYRCKTSINFSPVQALPRWYFKEDNDGFDAGFDLRSRLADTLDPTEAMLRAKDAAIRSSFYRRFEPSKFSNWPKFAKNGKFPDSLAPFPWPDSIGTMHMFATIAQFQSLATALADYVTALTLGQNPTAPITIP